MRYWGVHYDTGVHFSPEFLSREVFDHELIRYEMTAIREQMCANAVRVVGEELERLRFAGKTAADLGLTVFFNPWLINGTQEELIPYFVRGAQIAEELRTQGAEVVFVLGCELSLFNPGIIPGKTVYERVPWLISQRDGGAPKPSQKEVAERVNEMLRAQLAAVRQHFNGPVTYAAGRWEGVDWSGFDMVGLDYYRQEQSDAEYAQGLRDAAAHGKPVSVLEVGCCTYEGAEKKGGLGWTVLEDLPDGSRRWQGGEPPRRSEDAQAKYLADQFDVFIEQRVDSAFAFTFSMPYMIHDPDDAARDYDMASYSLTSLFDPNTPRGKQTPPWQPKKAYRTLADYFARFERARPAGS